MEEREKQRATHLLILLCYTIFSIVLIGESILLKWETAAVFLLFVGIIASWCNHILGKIPDSISLWLYFILTMLTFFFYGIHETSMYDLAPVMIVVIIMFSSTENRHIITFCVVTYYLIMFYDFLFVLGGALEMTPLVITRTLLHLFLVYMAGYLVKNIMYRRSLERQLTDDKMVMLDETRRRTEDLLTNVSHELRTPINAVTGITIVMQKNEENEDKKKNIAAIQNAGNRLFCQIEDILDYTEIDTGRIVVNEENYMISSIINDIITGERMWKEDNEPELIFDIDAGIPATLFGDGRKIKKILKHLVDNAVKFTKKGGIYVRISAIQKSYGINLCIKVSDTGIGISNNDIEKIAEQFYQLSGGKNRRAGGLGLGLSIVYGMVSALNGFIQIESSEGNGTTVSVSIPQKIVDEAPGMVVENREDLCLACFLRPEKYEVPQVREYYNRMISNLVHELNLIVHRVYDENELKKLVSLYQLTHLIIGKEEYEECQDYLENLDGDVEVIVVAESSFSPQKNSRIRQLRKPLDSFAVVNILNSKTTGAEELLRTKRMICPGIRVLVVDDEPMNLMVAEGIFKEYQMIVTKAASGKEAISLCEREDYDLIFLDHMMPEMDGVETLKLIRKINRDSDKAFTVIAFTANAVSGAREMFFQEGFDEFVSKPIEDLELERVLRKVLPKTAIVYVDERDRETEIVENKEIVGKEESFNEPISGGSSEKEQLRQLEEAGFDTKSALQFCRGDIGFYIELLTKFTHDAAQKEADISSCFDKEDYDNYHILVHSLKSTSKMIGAGSLSEQAKCAEEASKSHNAEYITEHQEELLDLYRKTVQCIEDVLDTGESSKTPQEKSTEISGEELCENLEKLKESFDTYEADKAEEILCQMSNYSYQGTAVGKLLADVRDAVDDFEFDTAAEKVQAFIGSIRDVNIRQE